MGVGKKATQWNPSPTICLAGRPSNNQVMRPQVGDRYRGNGSLCGRDLHHLHRKEMEHLTVRQISKLDSLGFKRQPLGFLLLKDCFGWEKCCGMKMCVGGGGGKCIVSRNMGDKKCFFVVCVMFSWERSGVAWVLASNWYKFLWKSDSNKSCFKCLKWKGGHVILLELYIFPYSTFTVDLFNLQVSRPFFWVIITPIFLGEPKRNTHTHTHPPTTVKHVTTLGRWNIYPTEKCELWR